MSLGHVILTLVIYALAVMRLTRLINGDTILDKPRAWLAAKAADAAKSRLEAAVNGQLVRQEIFARSAGRWSTAVYFVSCPWCVGLWIALLSAIVPVRLIGWPWWAVLPVALAASHITGVFAFAADTEDVDYEDETVE